MAFYHISQMSEIENDPMLNSGQVEWIKQIAVNAHTATWQKSKWPITSDGKQYQCVVNIGNEFLNGSLKDGVFCFEVGSWTYIRFNLGPANEVGTIHARVDELEAIREQMLREIDEDPEGAIGGRGNNLRV